MDNIKPIPGFDGYYASSDGRVYSTKSSTLLRELSPSPGGGADRDYLYFTACTGGRHHHLGVHQAVALAFIPKPADLEGTRLVVRHRDNNPRNNVVSNLLWGTQKQNLADREEHGTLTRGERNGGAKVTEALVIEIRRRRASGERCRDIAADTNLSHQQIHRIGRGQRWNHVGGQVAPRQRKPRKAVQRC